MIFAVLFVLAGLVAGCGASPEPPPSPNCYDTPDLPECSCDDGNPCTADIRDVDGCKNNYVPYGEPCVDTPGFCDVGAICREQCEPIPCFDSHVEVPSGCVYEQRPTGWTCNYEDTSGVCRDGVCSSSPTGT